MRGASVTQGSDICSLGLVLYRLLTGRNPYPPEIDGDHGLPRAVCDRAAVVLMALRKDPARHCTPAKQMADELFRPLEHRPVQARRGAWGMRASRFLLPVATCAWRPTSPWGVTPQAQNTGSACACRSV